jgi:hypothetical protein
MEPPNQPDPLFIKIGGDCGRPPVYIPTRIAVFGSESCFARLNKTFDFDDFIALGSQQDALVLDSPNCSIELNYTVKR